MVLHLIIQANNFQADLYGMALTMMLQIIELLGLGLLQ